MIWPPPQSDGDFILSNINYRRALHKDEVDRLLSPQRGHHSWLNTDNRKALIEALAANKKTVHFKGTTWPTFTIRLSTDKTKVNIFPHGATAPFTPTAWLDIEKLKQEVNGKPYL